MDGAMLSKGKESLLIPDNAQVELPCFLGTVVSLPLSVMPVEKSILYERS